MSSKGGAVAKPGWQQSVLTQPSHVRGLGTENRDALIVSTRKVDASWMIASRYGDDVWWPSGATTNTKKADTKLDFTTIPEPFRDAVKAMMYRLMRRGRNGKKRPGVAQLVKTLYHTKVFLKYLQGLGINSLSGVTPMVCSSYAHACKAAKGGRQREGRQVPASGRALARGTLWNRFGAVEALHELSQYTDDPMLLHPWPDTSADHLSGYGRSRRDGAAKTPLIPDDVFSIVFQKAWAIAQGAEELFDLRDEMEKVDAASNGLTRPAANHRKNQVLERLGWKGGYRKLKDDLSDVRTACYIVIASLSGCRNHELGFVSVKAYYSTEDDEGERYWWMRSKSTKTDEGDTEWMISEAAVTALKVMDRWVEPYQAMLRQEIENCRVADPNDLRIAEAQEHLGAVFVGVDKRRGNQVRTVSLNQWNRQLKAFAQVCGVQWDLASHQFRRKFANYAARSQFGDLRYLKEHFKHRSMDMTLSYAMNESQEMALYLEIEDELDEVKERVVAQWLNDSEPLAGGYGNNIVNWRSREQNITLFKSHAHMVRSIAQSTAIRSNGHAWCTADDNQCVGNDLERTRCGGGCNNAVIGRQHIPIYQGLYDELKKLEDCEDIGEGGRARVRRDLDRCRSVFHSLGHDPAGAVE